MKRLYLYLASRSKMGIKLITILQSPTPVMSRLTDMSSLKLPQIWERKIQQMIFENRMLYEPWVETAADFNELRSKLILRGYTNLPMGTQPLLHYQAYSKAPVADTSACPVRKTMLQKVKQ